jgi:hypothetical protein
MVKKTITKSEDTKEVIIIRKSKKDRQHNGQMKKGKKINNDLQNKHIQLKNNTNPAKTGRVSSSCTTSGTHRINLVTNPVISHEWGKDREVLTTSGTYRYRGNLW